MLLTLQNIVKGFGENTILNGISTAIGTGDRLGLIGENGAGKTTLIKVICGEYEPDSGDVFLGSGVSIGYLEQNTELNPLLTVWDEMENAFDKVLKAIEKMRETEQLMAINPQDVLLLELHSNLQAVVDAADGYHMDTQIKKILNGMAFPEGDYTKSVAVLSGGEHTRLCLARLLLQNPEILVLDEPTNHLDFATMEWLENYLCAYKGAVLVVSHDRYFVDKICTSILELENGVTKQYKGNYSAYLVQKEAFDVLRQKQHDADIEKAKKLEDYVARNLVRASTTKMAQSRRKQLEKMEITDAPSKRQTQLKFRFMYDIEPYLDLVTVKDLALSAGGKELVKNLSIIVQRSERLVIAGPNGTGKSTLLRALYGKLRPNKGRIRLAMGARISVFEQQQIKKSGSVQNAIWDKYPSMKELDVRSHLARFSFRGEDVYKPCAALSGGELARLRFAEMVLERPNLMFLDEPTNHLDIYSRETLTNALVDYTGTLILVTHDRYLMNSLACPILFIENGDCTLYASYEEMMHRNSVNDRQELVQIKAEAKPSYGKEQRRIKAQLRTRIKELEEEIENVGADVVDMENKLNSKEVVSDHEKITQLCDDLSDTRFHLDELYEEWSTLIAQQEEIEKEE